MVLIALAYFHAVGTFKKFSVCRYAMIAMLLFLTAPRFGQSFLWVTGASNYLYGILIVLAVMVPFRVQLGKARTEKYSILPGFFAAIGGLLLGVLGGWTNENTSVAMIVMMLLYMILFHFRKIKIHIWNVTACIGGILGCAAMVFAPGQMARAETTAGFGGIGAWLHRAVFHTCNMFVYCDLLFILFGVLLLIWLYQRKERIMDGSILNKKGIADSLLECAPTLIYLVGFLVSVYSMVVSPEFPPRAWSGPVILFLIAITSFCGDVRVFERKFFSGRILAVLFVTVLTMTTYVNAFFDVKPVYYEYLERVASIEQQAAEGKTVISVPQIRGTTGYSNYWPYGDLERDASEWPNRDIALFYGVKELIPSD